MKRILLATAATLALSLPAVAAPTNTPANNSSSQMNQPQQTSPSQSQMNNSNMQKEQQSQTNGQMGNNQQAQTKEQQRINPKQLSKKEIKSIQEALNKKGFSAGHVDGIWGRDTDTAIMNFQKKQGLPGDGHLNQQTLAALGVNMSQGEQGTVGAGTNNGSMNSEPSHMNKSTNGMNNSTNGMSNSSSSANQGQMNKANPPQPQNGGAK